MPISKMFLKANKIGPPPPQKNKIKKNVSHTISIPDPNLDYKSEGNGYLG